MQSMEFVLIHINETCSLYVSFARNVRTAFNTTPLELWRFFGVYFRGDLT
jgi:hypothetical protein